MEYLWCSIFQVSCNLLQCTNHHHKDRQSRLNLKFESFRSSAHLLPESVKHNDKKLHLANSIVLICIDRSETTLVLDHVKIIYSPNCHIVRYSIDLILTVPFPMADPCLSCCHSLPSTYSVLYLCQCHVIMKVD